MSNSSKDVLVSVIMGSSSDWGVMKEASLILEQLEISFEALIISAHRTPDRLYQYAKNVESRGVKVIIAGAGGAAHLPGMVASITTIPVLGVPVSTKHLKGLDSLVSIVQMPGGIPVGTMSIGESGAKNSAIMAASILSLTDDNIKKSLKLYRKKQTDGIEEFPI